MKYKPLFEPMTCSESKYITLQVKTVDIDVFELKCFSLERRVNEPTGLNVPSSN